MAATFLGTIVLVAFGYLLYGWRQRIRRHGGLISWLRGGRYSNRRPEIGDRTDFCRDSTSGRHRPVLDAYTFGESLAAVHLADMLTRSGDARLIHQVCRFITQQQRTVKALALFRDKRAREILWRLLRESWRGCLPTAPEDVRTHAVCVLTGNWAVATKQKGRRRDWDRRSVSNPGDRDIAPVFPAPV